MVLVRSHVNGVPDVRFIIIIAFTLMVGLMFTTVACNIYKNWWPFFAIVFYVTAPIPNFLCGNYCRIFGHARDARAAGSFITAVLIFSGLSLPAVMAHAGVIRLEAFVLTFIGGIIVYSSIVVYVHSYLMADPFTMMP
jgi:hypothetical protein